MLLAVGLLCAGQELEPRRWTHLPVGTNIAGLGYAHTDGELDVDPVLRIDDAEVRMDTVLASYNHYFGLAGATARLDLQVPFQVGRWDGILNGDSTTVRRDGLADPRIRFSLQFVGAPALEGEEFQAYRREVEDRTVVGAALAVRVPLGEYDDDKLINLGDHRYAFEWQAGAVQSTGPWSFELTGSLFHYTENDDFFGGNRLARDPRAALQVHVVRSFEPFWVAAGAAYGRGGEAELNGEGLNDTRAELVYGVSAGASAASVQALRLAYVRQDARREAGADTHTLLLTWALMF